MPDLVASGLAVGLQHVPGLSFNPHCPHTYCAICGAVYQGDIDRHPHDYKDNPAFGNNLALVLEYAMERRKAWSHSHSLTHTNAEHKALDDSGLHCTPDAAFKLAPYGIIPISDAIFSPETADALRAAPKVPVDDAECST